MMEYGTFTYGGSGATYAGSLIATVTRAIRSGIAWLSNKRGGASTAPRPGIVGD